LIAIYSLNACSPISTYQHQYDNATATSSSDKQLQPEADVKAMAQFQNNTESMMYLQECINDLQNRFYGLQLEQLQKERQQQMAAQNAIPSISSNSIWSTTGSEYSSGINSDRDSSSPTSSMRSSSPDLKVFWPQQQGPTKEHVYQAYQQQMHQIQQLKMQQQQLLQQKAFNQQQQKQQQQQPQSPIGAKPTRFVSQQSIQIGNKKVGKYVPPGKAKQIQQNKQNNNASTNSSQENKQKQGPYNKVLIVGLSAEYRSLNGVLNIFRPYGDVVSARVYRPYSTLPNEITRWCPSVEVQDSFSAVVEYPTARCAKFAVGVLRERVQSNRYRVVLLKPGAYEELQRQKLSILSSSTTSADGTNNAKVNETQSDSGNESFEVTSRVSSSDIASD
jgi:hypothetical protein